MAVIFFFARDSKYILDCVFNCNEEIRIVLGLIYLISFSVGGATFKTILHLKASSIL